MNGELAVSKFCEPPGVPLCVWKLGEQRSAAPSDGYSAMTALLLGF